MSSENFARSSGRCPGPARRRRESTKDPHFRLAFTLLLETGARLSEVLRATWEYVEMEEACLFLPSPKSGRPQGIPLAPSTVNILKNTPAMGPYLVPGLAPKKPRFDLKRPWQDLCKAAGLEGVRIHDVRCTYGLHAARQAGLHIASKYPAPLQIVATLKT
ncbi:MAG: site-specific integrase [Acidobacteriota bacterium]